MNVGLEEQCANTIPAAPEGQSPGCLFVSSTLSTWATVNPERFARDFQINDTVYRRLDPNYYAWLRSRMVLARKAATAGQLDAAAFEELRLRFNAVHEWAVRHFGEEQLQQAVRSLRAAEYKPPIAEDDRPQMTMPLVRKSGGDHISPDAVALVDGIAESALAIGWKRERLYGIGSGVFDPRRGLVCYLKAGDRIGEVTLHSIEIIHPLPVGGAPPLLQPRCRAAVGAPKQQHIPLIQTKIAHVEGLGSIYYRKQRSVRMTGAKRTIRWIASNLSLRAYPHSHLGRHQNHAQKHPDRKPGFRVWIHVEQSRQAFCGAGPSGVGRARCRRSGLSSRTTDTALRRPRQKRRAIGMSGRRTPAWRNSLSWRTCP